MLSVTGGCSLRLQPGGSTSKKSMDRFGFSVSNLPAPGLFGIDGGQAQARRAFVFGEAGDSSRRT
jgi:hypothetical protein